MRIPSVCVIGAGVSGLTTGIELLRRNYEVTVIADSVRDETTSSVAAAFWYPFWTGAQPDHSWYRPTWAWESFLVLDELAEKPESGVTRVSLLEYFDHGISPDELRVTLEGMWWKVIPRTHFHFLPSHEVEAIRFPHDDRASGIKFQVGITFQTVVINMSCYLEFLEKKFSESGGRVVSRCLQPADLEPLFARFDFVVNCSGLGARELVKDATLTPIEGVVLHIKPVKDLNDIVLIHTGIFSEAPVYIVPRGGTHPDVVLGGSITKFTGAVQPKHIPWSELSNAEQGIQADARNILYACRSLLPTLADCKPTMISVGYRPVRISLRGDKTEPVRLEPEVSGSMGGRLIHNYGHGGGGVTLSWGCAREVSKWLEWLRVSD